MTTASQIETPARSITHVLNHKGAKITLTGAASEVERTVRLVLDDPTWHLPDDSPAIVCPSWCLTRPEKHHWEVADDGLMMAHDGPSWTGDGWTVYTGANQYADGTLTEVGVMLELSADEFGPDDARALSASIVAASAALEADR